MFKNVGNTTTTKNSFTVGKSMKLTIISNIHVKEVVANSSPEVV